VRTAGLLLVLGMLAAVLGLYGCGPKKAPDGQEADESWARIKKAGTIKWGADGSGGGAPYVYKEKDDLLGWELEVMKKMSGHLGVKYELASVDWDKLPAHLKANNCDFIMNGYEMNEERKKLVDFSEPYCAYSQMMTVRVEDKDKYKTIADLKDKKWGILSGTESFNVLVRAGVPEANISKFEDSNSPYLKLKDRTVDAVLQDDMIAEFYAGKDAELFNNPNVTAPGTYAIAVRKGEAALLAEFNKVIKTMKENGELAEIYKTWKIWNKAQEAIGVKEKK